MKLFKNIFFIMLFFEINLFAEDNYIKNDSIDTLKMLDTLAGYLLKLNDDSYTVIPWIKIYEPILLK